MNRLFASPPPQTPIRRETKGKKETKDCHKDKADHSAVCIWKKVQKGGKKWQLNVKAH